MNPAQPGPDTRLCALADIPDPGAKGFFFRTDDQVFLGFVVRWDGTVSGYVDRCPHTGTPLAATPDRYLTRQGDLIVCSTHGAMFRPGDGLCLAGPCAGRFLWPWPVIVADGEVRTAP
ncbi:MAG TPA: Rieske 2Fe-2S domain-containing protein [Caulobacteraceae bacterium]|nr:Rieske 2Fe-2S domain-containing protein [Caulobacteraceae bacterium]